MDSINANQPEKNHEDLQGSEAGKKVKALADAAKSCFFCTGLQHAGGLKTRPMSPQKVDEQGNFWFLSASDSYKNAELKEDNRVQLFFQGNAHSDFLTLNGTASISTDKALIDELWNPLLRTWFTEGKEDPRITVIQVQAETGYYWDNKHGNAIAFAKMVAGAALGKTLDDSIEGKVEL